MGGGMFNMDFKSMRREAEKGGICERKVKKEKGSMEGGFLLLALAPILALRIIVF